MIINHEGDTRISAVQTLSVRMAAAHRHPEGVSQMQAVRLEGVKP